jgi:hypothetical protein
MVHTGMNINKYRLDFPLPEVAVVDMLVIGKAVIVMGEYSVEPIICAVGEDIVAGEIATEEIAGGQSLRISTTVAGGHFKGLSLRSNRTRFGNNTRRSVVFSTVKLLWLKSADRTHGITMLYGIWSKFFPGQSNVEISEYSRQNGAPIQGITVRKKRKETDILTTMLLTLTLTLTK